MKKKLLAAALLSLLAPAAKAALFINNTSKCTVQVRVYAHNENGKACELESKIMTIPPMGTIALNNAGLVDTKPGWEKEMKISGDPKAAVWDALSFHNGSKTLKVGVSGGCATVTNGMIKDACGADLNVKWSVAGHNILIELYN
ncbi:hypothetical protein [Taibaiella koreensis]|uniref:hypothetical protein n=1 Tax=Taibaiella koreensis TaxID=1268548 RepID=UPI000E5995B6|nr:hypothetical protein [Taibaiella koreensis]